MAIKKGHEVEMQSIPLCDVDASHGPADYDSRVPGLHPTSWAYCCARCWVLYGPGITGVGHGQRLIPATKG